MDEQKYLVASGVVMRERPISKDDEPEIKQWLEKIRAEGDTRWVIVVKDPSGKVIRTE